MADYKIGDEVYIHGYIDEIRKDTVIIRNDGGYFETATEEIIPTAQPDVPDINAGDMISRQAAMDAVMELINARYGWDSDASGEIRGLDAANCAIADLPSVQIDADAVSRSAVFDCFEGNIDGIETKDTVDNVVKYIGTVIDKIHDLPSAKPELSDAYMKAVWTWLIDYQVKVAELQGRYTPYEVLGWVANDWRKEHGQDDRC